jgi:hypothetical protein
MMMFDQWFMVNDGLAAAGRLPSRARVHSSVSAAELALLLLCGATAAAAVGLMKLGLRIPGHSIVLAVLPMALGLSLAPRHLAGSVMSIGAFGTATLLTAVGVRFGSGSIVSLCLVGPMMDIAMLGVRTGWRLYLGLVFSGVVANLLALGSRAAGKVFGYDLGTRPFDSWWTQAVFTYALSGLVAGLIGAICFFHFSRRGLGLAQPSEPVRRAGPRAGSDRTESVR